MNIDTGEIESELPVTDRHSKLYKDGRTPNYGIEIFEDVGRAVCIALLELAQCNPITRMATSHYKNLESLRKELIVQNNLLPYELIKDLRKEVQKERELMKAARLRLQAQILAKQLVDAKKAAKLKDKEERAEAVSTAEKIKEDIGKKKATLKQKTLIVEDFNSKAVKGIS